MKAIGVKAFLSCSDLESIKINSGVKTIGDHAFSGCSALSDVDMPASGLVSIGERAFYHCSGLKGIKIPISVTSLGRFAFEDCTSLEEVLIDEDLYQRSSGTFDGCVKLDKPEFYQ